VTTTSTQINIEQTNKQTTTKKRTIKQTLFKKIKDAYNLQQLTNESDNKKNGTKTKQNSDK